MKDVQYDPDARMIVIDVNKEKGDRTYDLSTMAYYMEKDVKVMPLFYDWSRNFAPSVDGQNLVMEKIIVYYVDEEPPILRASPPVGGSSSTSCTMWTKSPQLFVHLILLLQFFFTFLKDVLKNFKNIFLRNPLPYTALE